MIAVSINVPKYKIEMRQLDLVQSQQDIEKSQQEIQKSQLDIQKFQLDVQNSKQKIIEHFIENAKDIPVLN